MRLKSFGSAHSSRVGDEAEEDEEEEELPDNDAGSSQGQHTG